MPERLPGSLDDPDDWVLPSRAHAVTVTAARGGVLEIAVARALSVAGVRRLFVALAAGTVAAGDRLTVGPDGCFALAAPGDVVVGCVSAVDLLRGAAGDEPETSERGRSGAERPLDLATLARAVAALDADARVRAAPVEPVGPGADHASQELVALARAGDERGFRALAACVMPVAAVDACWRGTRARLGEPA